MALPAYRNLLRAIRIVFKDDTRLLTAAQHQSRTAFAQFRSLDSSSPEARARINYAQEVAQVLRENVVQGQIVEGESGKGEGQLFRLNIHENIERGDNDTIKNPDTGVVSPRKKCCSEK